MKTVDPIDPAELRALLRLVKRPLDKRGRARYNISHSGVPAVARKQRPRINRNQPRQLVRRAHLSIEAAVSILRQYLELALHAPEVRAMGFNLSVVTTHSTGEAPYCWRWAAEVGGCLWATGQKVYGRQVRPEDLIVVRAVVAREVRDRATVLLRNQSTRWAKPLGAKEAEVVKARDEARRALAQLTRSDTRTGELYAQELVVFTDQLEAHRVKPMRA